MPDHDQDIALDGRDKGNALVGTVAPVWATVAKVPDLLAGQVLTPGHVVGQALALLSPILLFVASITACIGAAAIFGGDVPPSVSGTLFASCFISFAGFLVLGQHFPSLLGSRYMRAVARRTFASRPDCWVDPSDPAAVFVDIIPRQNWHKKRFESASDIGFLKIDRRAGELTFEGDRERYRIPAESIASCDLEWFGRGFRSYYCIVLLHRRPSGEHSRWSMGNLLLDSPRRAVAPKYRSETENRPEFAETDSGAGNGLNPSFQTL